MANLGSEAETPSVGALNCISLADPDVNKSVSLVREACLESGFFYLIDHGIKEELIDEVFAQSKKFFDLPLDEKMKLLRNEKLQGYMPSQDETLDPDKQVNGDYKEAYHIGVEIPEDDERAQKAYFGPNIWPSGDLLPGWKEIVEQYHAEALRVMKAVARLIALALHMDAGFFDNPQVLGDPIATLRLLRYEDKVSDPERGIYGAGPHSDYGLVTLLAVDNVSGLQICKDKDAKPQKWEYVMPIKGGLIINIGDMLERWSNCIFRSTMHRVVLDGQVRYSVAFFTEPNHECIVECLPTCTSEENPPKFPPITSEAYLRKRYKDTLADLSSYAKRQT